MPKPSAFMTFVTEWKRKNAPNMSPAEAVKRVGPLWEEMSKEERQIYADKSLNVNLEPSKPKRGLGSTCVRTSIETELQAENAKKLKDKLETEAIERTIRNARSLKDKKFYFIFVNFFLPEDATPAEIGLVEFSLNDGVRREKHWFINPRTNFYGMLHTALTHATATHQLPLPPNALGNKEPHDIYFEILEFLNIDIRLPVTSFEDLPPLFTDEIYRTAVEKSLASLMVNKKLAVKRLKVYSIQQLFYLLKCSTSENKGAKIKNIHVTNIIFSRDSFEFEESIACQYHQEIDRARYCALSKVIRWAYTFADYMLNDLNIEFVPGKHCPKNTRKTSNAQSDICEAISKTSLNEKSFESDAKACKLSLKLEKLQTPLLNKSNCYDFAVPESVSPRNLWKRYDPSLPPDSHHFEIDPPKEEEVTGALARPKLLGRGIALLHEKSIPNFGATGRGRGRLLAGRGIAILNDTKMSDISSVGHISQI